MVVYNHGGLVIYKNPLCQIMHTMGFSLMWSKEYVKRYALILKPPPLFSFFLARTLYWKPTAVCTYFCLEACLILNIAIMFEL